MPKGNIRVMYVVKYFETYSHSKPISAMSIELAVVNAPRRRPGEQKGKELMNRVCINENILITNFVCNVYNMSGRVESDIQTRAEGESLYIRYNTDANVANTLKNDSSYKIIGEVI